MKISTVAIIVSSLAGVALGCEKSNPSASAEVTNAAATPSPAAASPEPAVVQNAPKSSMRGRRADYVQTLYI